MDGIDSIGGVGNTIVLVVWVVLWYGWYYGMGGTMVWVVLWYGWYDDIIIWHNNHLMYKHFVCHRTNYFQFLKYKNSWSKMQGNDTMLKIYCYKPSKYCKYCHQIL